VKLYLHSPSMSSWRGAQIKYRDNFTFTFIIFVAIFLGPSSVFLFSLSALASFSYHLFSVNSEVVKDNDVSLSVSWQECEALDWLHLTL
jgi:hypothetical protein